MSAPELHTISLTDFVTLALHFQSCARSDSVGVCGITPYALLMAEIQSQSKLRVTKPQLEDLLYHFKLSVCEQLDPASLKESSYQKLFENVKRYNPELFLVSDLGEIQLKPEIEDDNV